MIRHAPESLAGLVEEVIASSHSPHPSLGRQSGPSDCATFVPGHSRDSLNSSESASGPQHLKDMLNSEGEDKLDQELMHLIYFCEREWCWCDVHILNI